MACRFLNLQVLAVAVLAINGNSALSGEDKSAIEKGIRAGNAIATVLKDGKFRDSMKKLGENVGPYLGVFAPLVGVALSFIPGTKDSAELTYMRKKFEEVNQKLDIITSEFKEVKNAIDWSIVAVSYGVYERKIRAAESNLNRFYAVEGQSREHAKKHFIEQYRSHFDNSLHSLYDATMKNNHVFSRNVLAAVVKQTKNHKRKFEQFSSGLVKLFLLAIKVQVSYYRMRNWKTDNLEQLWTVKMNKLRSRMEQVSNEIKRGYKTQLKVDANYLIRNYYAHSNRGLVLKIANFVEDKYDWRYWFVAVYDDMHGYDNHAIYFCAGYTFLHKYGKNIIISSQDKNHASRFNQVDAENLLQNVERDIDDCKSDTKYPRDGRARTLVRNMDRKGGRYCVPYALHMAVKAGSGLYYTSSHTAYRNIDKNKRCRCGADWNRPKGCERCRIRCYRRGGCGYENCYETNWNHNMIVFG